MNPKKPVIFSLLLLMAIATTPAYAQDLTYDRYAPVYDDSQPTADSSLKTFARHFLVYPFELLRWPNDQFLIFAEKHHIPKKLQWMYETIQNRGISPRIHASSFSEWGAGTDIDFLRLAKQKSNFPDATLTGWVDWIPGKRREVGGIFGWERIAGTGIRSMNSVRYENRPSEHFYGIGPYSSGGDGAVYSMETTEIQTTLGYAPSPVFSADLQLMYQNINISSGRDGGRGQRGELPTFSFDSTPGIYGDSILTVGGEVVHDTRNQKENSSSGGKRRFAMSFNEGLNSSEAEFIKYEIEVSQYFRLLSDRRVFAIRFLGEHADEVNDHQVPFHQMSRLGGFGINNQLSHTLRGYVHDRFYDESLAVLNLEYRYTIWEYRELKVDTVFFWDEGQVFGEFSEFKLNNFRESYGGGFRFSLANVVLLSVEVAHGDEGTNFYVKTHAPF